MDPQLRRPLLIVMTTALLVPSVAIELGDGGGDDPLAFALGATLARFLIALTLVMGVRLIALRIDGRVDRVTFPALTCAAAVLTLALTAAVVGSRQDAAQAHAAATIAAPAQHPAARA